MSIADAHKAGSRKPDLISMIQKERHANTLNIERYWRAPLFEGLFSRPLVATNRSVDPLGGA